MMYSYLDICKQRPQYTLRYPTDFDRAQNEYLKLVNEYAQEYHSLKKGRAYARAWLDELFPDGLADLTWKQVYWDLKTHREHPPECDCTGSNNPTGCQVCRVSARVDFN
ncbi:hypothetical protein KA005_70025 [bacterium]|nr:hypothetical protein [bacterium]